MVHRVFLFLQCACHSCASGNWIWRESYLSISCGTERFYQRLFKNQFFSDLKGSFCIPVMRIKYCISPKSYYTVMNIPLHCQEPGGGAPWCPSYWWAVILLKGSVWTRSQKAWIFSCGVPKTSGSSWAAATLVIPVSADLPSHCTKCSNWRSSLSFKKFPSTYRMRLRREKWHPRLLSCRCHCAYSGTRTVAFPFKHQIFGSSWSNLSFWSKSFIWQFLPAAPGSWVILI